ncbi:hypothetical protein B0H13DRAFT_1850490 [Mycena leptocephala]|nr:hypothetical protein B0H13DRAFT_1850490 [Mycena leptocephala]
MPNSGTSVKGDNTANSKAEEIMDVDGPVKRDVSPLLPAAENVAPQAGSTSGGGLITPSVVAPPIVQSVNGGLHGGGVAMHPARVKNGRMAPGGLRPSMTADGDVATEEELRRRMRAGKWCVHELIGAVVCTSALRGVGESADSESEGEIADDPCVTCTEYMTHVGNAFADNDGSLEAALKLRDFGSAQHARPTDIARLEGELAATRKSLELAQGQIIDFTKEMVAVAADRAAFKNEAGRAWQSVSEWKHYAGKMEAQLDLERRHSANIDDERARKKTAIQQRPSYIHASPQTDIYKSFVPSSGVQTMTSAPSAGPPQEDIVMSDLRKGKGVDFDWGSLRGIPKMTIQWRYFGIAALPPPSVLGPLPRIPLNQLRLMRSKQLCWVVGFVVFKVYYDARTAAHNNRTLTDVQRYSLDHFQMAPWLWEIFKTFNADSAATEENRRFWNDVRRPTCKDSPHAFAAYIQRTGSAPEGCEFEDEFHTLKSRVVRGCMVWQAIEYKLPKYRPATQLERENAANVARALMMVVLFPGTYRDTIKSSKLTIAPEERLVPWPDGDVDYLTDEKVIKRLVAMGVTLAVVDDMFLYVRRLALRILASPRVGWDALELQELVDASDAFIQHMGGPPSGITAAYGEYIPRPPGLPKRTVSPKYQLPGTVSLRTSRVSHPVAPAAPPLNATTSAPIVSTSVPTTATVPSATPGTGSKARRSRHRKAAAARPDGVQPAPVASTSAVPMSSSNIMQPPSFGPPVVHPQQQPFHAPHQPSLSQGGAFNPVAHAFHSSPAFPAQAIFTPGPAQSMPWNNSAPHQSFGPMSSLGNPHPSPTFGTMYSHPPSAGPASISASGAGFPASITHPVDIYSTNDLDPTDALMNELNGYGFNTASGSV